MTEIEITGQLYDAFRTQDPGRLLALLHRDFRGDVTAGLPHGWGGAYEGPEAMLRQCWGPVFSLLDTRPVPEDIVATVDGRVLVRGPYRGTARESGRRHEAVFTHVLEFEGGRISALSQVTDSHRWHEAVA